MAEPEILLTQERAIEACELFLNGMRSGFGADSAGTVSLSKATEVLRNAFETVKFVNDPADIGG